MSQNTLSEVDAVFERVLACELATLSADGSLVVTPMAALWEGRKRQFVLTTSISMPGKLGRIKDDSRVSLLFSDFTGSGLCGAPAVLVQGRAEVSDDVMTVKGLEDYWAMLFRKKPGMRSSVTDVKIRGFFPECFYWRAMITVSAEKIWTVTGPIGDQRLERLT